MEPESTILDVVNDSDSSGPDDTTAPVDWIPPGLPWEDGETDFQGFYS